MFVDTTWKHRNWPTSDCFLAIILRMLWLNWNKLWANERKQPILSGGINYFIFLPIFITKTSIYHGSTMCMSLRTNFLMDTALPLWAGTLAIHSPLRGPTDFLGIWRVRHVGLGHPMYLVFIWWIWFAILKMQ